MKVTETISALPTQQKRSARTDNWRCITSADPGKSVPVAYAWLHREDQVARGSATIQIEQDETVLPLMNAVGYTAYAHFIPMLAFERFERSMDRLNRAYLGQPDKTGGDVVPYFENMPYDRNAEIFKTMGIHFPDGANVNSALVEAYNVLQNHRRRARSTKITERNRLDTTLANCFWRHSTMSHIVPDYDQALIDGEVALDIKSADLPVKGLGVNSQSFAGSGTLYETGGETNSYTGLAHSNLNVVEDPNNLGFPAVYAELQSQGITLSLQNIELAKKTAAWARIREQYSGMEDEELITLLLQGIRVPDEMQAQPILLARQSGILGMNQRYATDSGNLDKSVTTGMGAVQLNWRTPPMNTGGIVLVTVEVVPDQLFERQQDHFLASWDVEDLPDAVRDDLDMDKVAVVPNSHVDVEHSNPTGTFGYAGLNYQWNRDIPRIGGKFFRKLDDAFVEDRQRIWSLETTDPALTEDFYLANGLHKKVFADNLAQPYEITTLGGCEILGNTIFGKRLSEDTGEYTAIEAEAPDNTPIDQNA